MISNTRPIVVRVTHIPTGLSATCTQERTERKAKEAAMRLLRSRLWAAGHAEMKLEEVSVYDLPDSDPFPHELSDYKKNPEAGHEP